MQLDAPSPVLQGEETPLNRSWAKRGAKRRGKTTHIHAHMHAHTAKSLKKAYKVDGEEGTVRQRTAGPVPRWKGASHSFTLPGL